MQCGHRRSGTVQTFYSFPKVFGVRFQFVEKGILGLLNFLASLNFLTTMYIPHFLVCCSFLGGSFCSSKYILFASSSYICQVLREPVEVFPLSNFAPWDTLFHCFVDLLCTKEVLMVLESIEVFKSNSLDGISSYQDAGGNSPHTIAPAITTLLTGQLWMVDYPMTGKYPSLYLLIPKKDNFSDQEIILEHLPISTTQRGFLPIDQQWMQDCLLYMNGIKCLKVDPRYVLFFFVFFFDLQKAFNSVPHCSLVEKLSHQCVCDKMDHWQPAE